MDTQQDYITVDLGAVRAKVYMPYRCGITTPQGALSAHEHRLSEFQLLLDGEAIVDTERGDLRFRAGNALLIPALSYHNVTSLTRGTKLFAFNFSAEKTGEDVSGAARAFMKALGSREVTLVDGAASVAETVSRLIAECRSDGFGREQLIAAYYAQLFIGVARALPQTESDAPAAIKRPNPVDYSRIYAIDQYFVYNYVSADISELAVSLGLSVQHLRRFLRENYGSSFTQLLNMQRVSVARQLLRHTDKTVTEVWRLAGFGSAQSFAAAFRSIEGRAPSEFRRAAK